MKGIILAGGLGSRLSPLTKVISKQLLPIYDKPMIYYPLSLLLLAGVRDILIISTPNDINLFERLLENGDSIGVKISYIAQDYPRGIVDAFIIGEKFINGNPVCLILGDNILFGSDLSSILKECVNLDNGALVFAYPVKNPEDFGVIEIDSKNNVISIEEKPNSPKSMYAIPGIYFYDNTVVKKAKEVVPSIRNELEITSLNEFYLKERTLKVKILGRGFAWLDTGTIDSMKSASEFVEAIQKRQGFYISCIEEIAWRMGYISRDSLNELGLKQSNCDYGKYILSLAVDHKNREL